MIAVALIVSSLAAAVLPVTWSAGNGAEVRVAAVRGANLYVSPGGHDSAACSVHAPCRQLDRADELAKPGTTVHVRPGSYRRATLTASGTASKPIRYVSTKRWAAVIVNRRRLRGAVVAVQGKHVILKGFQVTSAVTANVDGIAISGSYSAAVGNRVHDLHRSCGSNGGIVAGDAKYSAHDIDITGNYVSDIGDGPRDGSCALLHGIYAAVPRVRVVNNVVVRALADGITSWHAATRLTIVNNTVVGNGGDGILVGNGDVGASAAGNTRSYVANNLIASNHNDAISEEGPHPVHNTFADNTFYANGRDVLDQWGDSTQVGTMTSDPLFTDAAHNFRLRRGSGAVGSGTGIRAPATDFLGVRRCGAITRGAYEYVDAWNDSLCAARRAARQLRAMTTR